MENDKLSVRTAGKLLSSFLWWLENKGIISKVKNIELNVTEFISQNDVNNDDVMDPDEMETMIKKLFEHCTR